MAYDLLGGSFPKITSIFFPLLEWFWRLRNLYIVNQYNTNNAKVKTKLDNLIEYQI